MARQKSPKRHAGRARVEKVIAVEPDHGRALGYGATLLAELGEAERAKEWIERGMLLDPDNTILHFNFVCALARLREIDDALDLHPLQRVPVTGLHFEQLEGALGDPARRPRTAVGRSRHAAA